MKTPESWADARWNEFSEGTSLKEWVAKIQSDAFAAGERKGRIEGIKQCISIIGTKSAPADMLDQLLLAQNENT